MSSENNKLNNTPALIKWFILGLIGIACIVTALICFSRQIYTWVFAAAFVGCFLASTAWKRLRLLRAAARAVKAGRSEIMLFYRDANLKETQQTVIPAGSDDLFFYGFSPERKDIRMFRWNRMIRVQENEKDLTKDELLSRMRSLSPQAGI
jgi:hypothetical protein